jgi:hypothetical protein
LASGGEGLGYVAGRGGVRMTWWAAAVEVVVLWSVLVWLEGRFGQ